MPCQTALLSCSVDFNALHEFECADGVCLLCQQAFKAAVTCACEMGTVVEGMVTVLLVTILDSFRLFVLIHVITVSQTSNQRCCERTSLVEHFQCVRFVLITGDGGVSEISRISAG